MLDVTCEHCGKILKIPEEYLGQRGRCNRCHGVITVTVAPLKFSAEAIQAAAESEQEQGENGSLQDLPQSSEAIIPHKCPMCGTLLHIPARYAGQRKRCTTCNAMLTVPRILTDEEPPQPPRSTGTVSPTVPVSATSATKQDLTLPVRPSVQYFELGTRPHYEDAQALYMGLAGAILLFAGTFAPLFSVPLFGHLNYFGNGRGDGVIVIVLAAAAFIMTLARQFRYLYVLGLIALGVMFVTFFKFQATFNEVTRQMHEDLPDNFFAGIAEGIMVNSLQMQWGWAVLVIGAGLIIAASAVHKEPSGDTDATPGTPY